VICNIANYCTCSLSLAIVIDLLMIWSAMSTRHVYCDVVRRIAGHHVIVNHSCNPFYHFFIPPFCHFVVLLFHCSTNFRLTSIQFPSNICHRSIQHLSPFDSKSVIVAFKVRRHLFVQFYASIRSFTIFFNHTLC